MKRRGYRVTVKVDRQVRRQACRGGQGGGGLERVLQKHELGQCLSGQTGGAVAGGAHHL